VPVLIYQLVIITTLILTRFLAPNRLLLASWIWTGLTLVNLFWPPLIVIQLIVIWGTFGLLKQSRRTPNTRASKSGDTDGTPNSKVIVKSPQPAPLPASHERSLRALQRGANKLATAVDELDAYVERQKLIQAATIVMLSGYKVERHRIEVALGAAERGLQLKGKLDADQEFKKRFEKYYAEYRALFDETPDKSTAAGPSDHKCVDLRLPSRHRDPEIASAVERKYTETINDYSEFLREVTQRLQRQEGLRDIFEEEMLSIGGSQILGRIKSFEAGKEWSYTSTSATIVKLLGTLSIPGQNTPGTITTDHGGLDMLDRYVRSLRERDRHVVRAVANHAETPDQHAPSVSPPVATTASREPPSPSATQLLSPDATEFLGPSVHTRQSPSLPHNEREEIKKAAIALRIPALYHFTRRSNLESILKHGLCSISRAAELGIKASINDRWRLDGYPDAISLSIAFPNDRMFYKYRQNEPNGEWSILAINPAILWSKNCAFCKRNASDHRIRERSLADLMNGRAFGGMFEMIEGIASREEQRLMDYDPTDPQAEVLVFETIEPDQIWGVGFDSHEALNACSHLLGDRLSKVLQMNKGLFGARTFARTATN